MKKDKDMDKNIIIERVALLREELQREHLEAFIFPSTDAHNSEYVADHWKAREWISGFDGSAGTAVVTLTAAALWTDSRYFLAAEEQLQGTPFELQRLKMPGTPTIAEWIGAHTQPGAEVGIDGSVASYASVQLLTAELRGLGGMTLRLNFDPMERIWTDRPPIPDTSISLHRLEYAGEATPQKLMRIRQALRVEHCDGMLVSALDDIAWVLNLRGHDVHCNPVFVAYLVIEPDSATLFTSDSKLTAEVKAYLAEVGVAVRPYGNVAQWLKKEYFHLNIRMDADETSSYLAAIFPTAHVHAVFGRSPIPSMKAVKNEAEIRGFRAAMLRDGIAMVKFLKWLRPAVAAGGQTERSIDRKLTALRAEQPLFKGVSFDTIAAYQEHGAIVHYEATEVTDAVLRPEGLLLLDSGAQYLDGTTDITRTIQLGSLTDEQRRIYTLVLKGHIQLELARFPEGTCGTQLDALAREAMWREGLNYMHGTGHGVGAYLNVHEGPHQIRMEHVAAPLHAGMVVTDEPGIYLAGRFGVRIENTLLIRPYRQTEFGAFLEMESLTLCPIDTSPILPNLLLPEEREWLNAYHERVLRTLGPHLEADELAWLAEATQAI